MIIVWSGLGILVPVLTFLVLCIGGALARKQGRVLFDPQTGQHVELKPRHSFFFIPVAYWAYILVFLGVVFFFV